MKRFGLIVALAACSVPATALEGKQCPCTDGYVCDTPTNRCFLSNGDGGVIDSLGVTSCLGGSTQEIYRYAGMFDWLHADATWTGGAEIKQTSVQLQDTYTYKTSAELTNTHDYHVTATMRSIASGNGSPSLGIVLRAQLSAQDRSRYACTWIPKGKELRLEATTGGNTTALGSALVATNTPDAPITMEARVVGSTLACCIREYPSAKLTGLMNADVTSGYPGLQTNRMEAAFGSFAVTVP